MTPAGKGLFGLTAYMVGLTEDMLYREREEVLTASPEDIRACAAYIRAFMEEEYLCTVGNAQKIKAEQNLFLKTENLF